uniref:sensor histidine kinase n=1 Tax=Brevundimonas sp. LF-1 TaxID=3126100 RepID=UPI00403D88EF
MEQTNSQLEEQAQILETQRDDLERGAAALTLKARELEQASQYKSDFLANMSHELRTPLNSLLILSKLLADNPEGSLSEEQVNYARTIQSSGNDLLALINDILDLSKIEAGHIQAHPEAVSMQRLTEDLRQTFQPIADDRGLPFEIEVDASVDLMETDRQRLEQILKNLLSNAFKLPKAAWLNWAYPPCPATRSPSRSQTPASAFHPSSRRAFSRPSSRRTAPSAANTAEQGWGSQSRANWRVFSAADRAEKPRRRRQRLHPCSPADL